MFEGSGVRQPLASVRKNAGMLPARSDGVIGSSMLRARFALLWLLGFVACASGFEVAQAWADGASTQVDTAVRHGVDATPLAKAAPEVRYYHACDEAPPESTLEAVDSEDPQHVDGPALRAAVMPSYIAPVPRFVRPAMRKRASISMARVDLSTAFPRGPPSALR